MRKVKLCNVDPAIDDPDVSTWCESSPSRSRSRLTQHPALNHHSRLRPDLSSRQRQFSTEIPRHRREFTNIDDRWQMADTWSGRLGGYEDNSPLVRYH